MFRVLGFKVYGLGVLGFRGLGVLGCRGLGPLGFRGLGLKGSRSMVLGSGLIGFKVQGLRFTV